MTKEAAAAAAAEGSVTPTVSRLRWMGARSLACENGGEEGRIEGGRSTKVNPIQRFTT